VAVDAGDDLVVASHLTIPAALLGIVPDGDDVGELIAQRAGELGARRRKNAALSTPPSIGSPGSSNCVGAGEV